MMPFCCSAPLSKPVTKNGMAFVKVLAWLELRFTQGSSLHPLIPPLPHSLKKQYRRGHRGVQRFGAAGHGDEDAFVD